MGNQMCCTVQRQDLLDAQFQRQGKYKTREILPYQQPQFVELNQQPKLHSNAKTPRVASRKNLEDSSSHIFFQASVGTEIEHLDFSQRRLIGFRKHYEFDKKRILVANKNQLKVIGYSHENRIPFEVVSYDYPQSDLDDEELVFARFLDDLDPKFILAVTYSPKKNKSQIKLLQQCKQAQELGFTFQEEDNKTNLINQIKLNIEQQDLEDKLQYRDAYQDNFQVVIKPGDKIDIVQRINNGGRIHKEKKKINLKTQSFASTAQNTGPGFQSLETNTRVRSSQEFQQESTYSLYERTLTKFKDTKFTLIKYQQCSYQGKLLFTIDQNGQLRVHIFSGIDRIMDLNFQNTMIDEFSFAGVIRTREIRLSYKQFSPRNQILQNDIVAETLERPIAKQLISNSDFTLLIYKNLSYIDIFNKNGVLMERDDLREYFSASNLSFKSVDMFHLARLNWSDRYFDLVQQSQKNLPRKLIAAGTCSARDSDKNCSYVILIDRMIKQQSIIKVFKTSHFITAISYGPYDNGHVLVGLSNGTLLVFNSLSMAKMHEFHVFQGQPIDNICLEPANFIIASSKQTQQVATISLIKRKTRYMYIDLGKRRYCTILMEEGKRARSSSPMETIKQQI